LKSIVLLIFVKLDEGTNSCVEDEFEGDDVNDGFDLSESTEKGKSLLRNKIREINIPYRKADVELIKKLFLNHFSLDISIFDY